jgi:hypothetical protein
MLTLVFNLYLLLFIHNLKPSLATETNQLKVEDAYLHICSANGFCSKIDEFTVDNDPFNIDANRKSDVKIFLKQPVSCADANKQDTFGFLSTHGAVSTKESQIPDIRRTKV